MQEERERQDREREAEKTRQRELERERIAAQVANRKRANVFLQLSSPPSSSSSSATSAVASEVAVTEAMNFDESIQLIHLQSLLSLLLPHSLP